jgi:hypothetical protein
MDPNNLTNQLATDVSTKSHTVVYYDQLPYPRGYRVPEFSKFSGEDDKITFEHVGQFILQCGQASANDR